MAHVETPTLLSIVVRSVCLGVLLCAPSWAQALDEAPGSQSYIEKSREGWFFYKDPSPVEEDEEDEAEKKPIAGLPKDIWTNPEKYKELLKKLPIDGVDLSKLPSEFLKEFVTAKRTVALDNPTVASVKDYIVVQQEAYDRSEKFTSAWQLAMYTNPQLDYHAKHPTSQFGHQIDAQVVKQEDDSYLIQASKKVGLFFFFSSTCPYCQEQSKIVKLLQDEYSVSVFPVTIDGKGLPEYPSPAQDNGMVEKLGVHMVPMIYLAIPEERFMKPIGAGIMTLSELRERVLVTLKKRQMLVGAQG